ncbi:MAG: hypothetical protein ABJP34_08875 [Erythrobacter sp.]
MERFFWFVAVVGFGLIGCVQLKENRSPERALTVAGMGPQIEEIRKIAARQNWAITCEGVSGEMTTLGLSLNFRPNENLDSPVLEEIAMLASVTSMTSPDCDLDAPTLESDNPTGNLLLAFVGPELQEPYLQLAKSCGFTDANLSTISRADREISQTPIPTGWKALYGGPDSANRYGPNTCIGLMRQHLEFDQ